MAKATMKLIQQLRAQLPPEAAEKLDDLESLAADEKPEEGDDADMPPDDMYGAGDEAPSDEEGSDEPVDVNASAMDEGPTEEDEEEVPAPKAKKKAKKGLSFFG